MESIVSIVALLRNGRYALLAGSLPSNALSSTLQYDADFSPESEICKFKLRELKSKLAAQELLMAKPRSHSNNATISSFKVSNLIIKNGNLSLQGNL
jgi:hypothetical protein